MTDVVNNRSSAPTPESLGAHTAQSAALVNETIAAVFAHLGPMLEKMAITPEKLREANKPYVDPAKIARDLRETQIWRADMEDQRKQTQAYQDQCLHQDDNQRSAIRPIRNFPDRQPRGICMKCHALIHPKQWVIGSPDEKNPRGRAYLQDAHKDYLQVLQVVAKEGS
jgi:hypothetical protein